MAEKMDELDNHITCIPQHSGFQASFFPLFFNVGVLDTAYYQFWLHYKIGTYPSPLHVCVLNLLIHGYFFIPFFVLFLIWLQQKV